MKHEIVRHRHELRRRRLSVKAVYPITPGMLRIVLTGEELVGFTSLSPDDHIKLVVPGLEGETERRDYTPRRYDPMAQELLVDFALHEAGPATQWAMNAKPGDPVEIGGPRGSAVIPSDFDWWLLIGDETALPAIGRRLEELPAGVRVISVVAISDPPDEQTIVTAAEHRAIWVHRPAARANDPEPILDALAGLTLPAGDGFIWIAAEAIVARAVRAHVMQVMGHPMSWTKASGYWLKGTADAQEKIESSP